MREIAAALVRSGKGSVTAALIALLLGVAVLTGCGVLLQTGLQSGATAERYAGVELVIGARQSVPVDEDVDPVLPDRAPLPADAAAEIADVPGVLEAIGDRSTPVGVVDPTGSLTTSTPGLALLAHPWSSAAIGPFRLTAGAAPTDGEFVLDAALADRIGVSVGDRVQLVRGAVPTPMRVSGVVAADGALERQSAVFVDDIAYQHLDPTNRLDTVGVRLEPGTDPGAVADQISVALAPAAVVAYAGNDRGDAEFLDIGAARGDLVTIALSFAGFALLVVAFVAASILSLALSQRRQDFALIRAIAATPRQLHRMIAGQLLRLSGVAVLLGAGPGLGFAFLLRRVLVGAGAMPADLDLAIGPIPVLAAGLLITAAAIGAGRMAARKLARLSPVEAIEEATVEPRRLGRARTVIGLVLVAVGICAAILPLFLPGEAAMAGAGSAAIAMVAAVALLGPRVVQGIGAAIAGPLSRLGATGYLAAGAARTRSRRMAAVITPLVMTIALGCVQLFTATTVQAAAAEQAAGGIRAPYAVSSTTGGVDPTVVDRIRDLRGISGVTPVVRGQVFVRGEVDGRATADPYPAQGIDAGGSPSLDLSVREGALADLTGKTVALSRMSAATIGVDVGGQIDLLLGDGTPVRPRVVAIYDRGLGFGDVTLPRDLLAGGGSGPDDLVLVATQNAAGQTALQDFARRHPGLQVADRASVAAAGDAERRMQSWVNLAAMAVLLLYVAVSVVNTLVMSTRDRDREFALLRLIGATARQIRRMTGIEAAIVVGIAVVLGTLVSLPALIGVSIGMTGSFLPTISVPAYLAIVGGTALLGALSIAIPTRVALRGRSPHPESSC